jgi:elongation factor 2
MRALDGVIILVCAVEGIMPQTETVIRQALKERVRPILFINKVDRLINELKVSKEEMQKRFVNIITEVNKRIATQLPEPLNKEWQVRPEDGSVAFGSAYNNWAVNVPSMKRTGIAFKDVYDYCRNNDQRTLAKKSPVHEVLLNMVIKHVPNPVEAQKLRIPIIWKGDKESPVGKSMLSCDASGPVAMMVTKIIVDPHAGEVAMGRLFSGTVTRGMELWVAGMPNVQRTQTVSLSVGADRIAVDHMEAGNIVAIAGLKDAIAGSTISSDPDMEPFEKITHYTEPVVTVAIEAKHMKDLPKLVEVLRSVAKADPSIQVEINNETGEHLLSGMGELHLEITIYRIVNDHKIDIKSSPPIVVYRENIKKKGGPFEGKSPNKHNRFFVEVESLPENIIEAMKTGEIQTEGKIKDAKELANKLQELGMDREEARGVVGFSGQNIFIDATKGIQYLNEVIELCKQGFEEAMNLGPLAQEKVSGIKVRLVDAKLHEDSIHRGPAQVIPAFRSAVYGAMATAGRILLEPMTKIHINCPESVMGDTLREIQQRRGVIEEINQEGDVSIIVAQAPVAEMFGFASAIRGATQGRALWSTENAGFVPVPSELQPKIVEQIRTRKGLKPEPYDASYYSG